jgi:hypothetical protein
MANLVVAPEACFEFELETGLEWVLIGLGHVEAGLLLLKVINCWLSC